MHILYTTLRFLGEAAAVGAMIYGQYRYARWNLDERNKDMKSYIQTIFNGKK